MIVKRMNESSGQKKSPGLSFNGSMIFFSERRKDFGRESFLSFFESVDAIARYRTAIMLAR